MLRVASCGWGVWGYRSSFMNPLCCPYQRLRQRHPAAAMMTTGLRIWRFIAVYWHFSQHPRKSQNTQAGQFAHTAPCERGVWGYRNAYMNPGCYCRHWRLRQRRPLRFPLCGSPLRFRASPGGETRCGFELALAGPATTQTRRGEIAK